MSWQWLDQRTIRHNDGHSIELKSGSWKVPMDIEPRFVSKLDSVISARLIRTGLEFAVSTTFSLFKSTRGLAASSGNNPEKPGKPAQHTRRVLTLKK